MIHRLHTIHHGRLQMAAHRVLWAMAVIILLNQKSAQPLSADQIPSRRRCVILELYTRDNCDACDEAEKLLGRFSAAREGVELRTFNLDRPGEHVRRFQQIQKRFRLEEATVPAVFACNYFLDAGNTQTLQRRMEAALTVNVYVRAGCDRCSDAKAFLSRIRPDYPGMRFTMHEVTEQPQALDQLQKIAQRHGQAATSLPAFHFCNDLVIGFLGAETTGQRLEEKLRAWTVPCPRSGRQSDRGNGVRRSAVARAVFARHAAGMILFFGNGVPATASAEVQSDGLPPIPAGDPDPLPPLPPAHGAADSELGPVPGTGEELPALPPLGDEDGASLPAQERPDSINVPLLGELKLNRLGMPAFTFLVGLVDGFNPCAMWVLLFLLAILVNVKSRWKIFAVAGTFVVISGIAYFAFMAAWLNVFLLVGYLRWVQVSLGTLAVVVGAIHIKDFFAFHRGPSLSIPDSMKPTIYARVRKIVTAENLPAAIAGASVLAVLVNIVELLCTAGLPAMYTQILTLQQYPAWMNYAYLGLYNLAYMLDDMLMVTIVVVTLGRHKLQEREGRWLKLISGIAICLLGLVMVFKPEWLV